MPRLRRRPRLGAGLLLLALTLGGAGAAHADTPNGPALLRVLGDRAEATLAPGSGVVSGLVELPPGSTAASLGLREATPGLAWLTGRRAILAFAAAHPRVRVEVAPTLHLLNDRVGLVTRSRAANLAGADGTGTLIGVADTGADLTHPDFLAADGTTRVEWMLDLSRKPRGVHAALEAEFGVRDEGGALVAGAVYSKADIDDILARRAAADLPTDDIGHGSHVTGIAAGGGGAGKLAGVAPKAGIVSARITRPGTDSIDNDDLVRAVGFMFAVGTRMKRPVAVNLSLGSDFGPHDGSMLWERAVASFVGPSQPGRVIVAAAGNSGSVAELPIHQSVHVPARGVVRVPVRSPAASGGSVQVWASFRGRGSVSVGLDLPTGTWLAPVAEGTDQGRREGSFRAGIVNGSAPADSPVPVGHRGAVVVWTGAWPAGVYSIVLANGADTPTNVELYLQSLGGHAGGDDVPRFENGVREGTINLPAAHPSIIGVGCTVNRTRWTSGTGSNVGLTVPRTDPLGLLPTGEEPRALVDGEVCWFSSAGPNSNGVPKPEIAAPGGVVASTASHQAPVGSLRSIFTTSSCPPRGGSPDPSCLLVDSDHGVSSGTSMASPIVTGVAALLLQRDPTLTQDKVAALLQAGAHPFRGPAPFQDQNGPGEVDALGSLDALERSRDPRAFMPSARASWMALSSDYVPADGSRDITAILELRTADGVSRADLFDLQRLAGVVTVEGTPQSVGPVTRRAPGLYSFVFQLGSSGLGLKHATFGATFDGAPIVPYRALPIATDTWNAGYPSRLSGGCATTRGAPAGGTLVALGMVLVGLAVARRRR
ncbi:MAG TPA: S8 family serine peptidase [Polyangiaceae bacterium]|nr:S8 family serine peptidase [Polyangiaceae bacterium]